MRRYVWVLVFICLSLTVNGRERISFNTDWRLCVGDVAEASQPEFDDSQWQRVTLPYAFNGDEAFRKDIVDLTDTICWYRKTFSLSSLLVPPSSKVFVEFEGVRQGADVYLNGHHLGYSENGVMAFGFDLTPYIKEGENVIAVRCDNSWTYRSRRHDSRYQWNDRNFPAGSRQRVYVFTNASEVELFLNGKSLGVKLNDGKGSMQHVIMWDVDYQPGTILAVARNNEGKEVALHDLQTAGKAVKLKIEEEVSE